MFTSQSGNTAQGDLVGGNQHKTVNNFNAPQSPLAKLYEKFRLSCEGQPLAAQISDQLNHYCSVDTDGDVRGLEEKLTAADRAYLIRAASMMKQAASKVIMKWQTSGAAQDIITFILSHLYTAFILEISPAIQAGKTKEEVDAMVNERVIKPTWELLGDNDLGLTTRDLLGFLFYLGGNCHIRWDKC